MNKLFRYIKYICEIFFNLPLLFYKNKNKDDMKIVLMLTPQYLNFGDHAIAVAEKSFIRKHYPQIELLDINYSFYQFWKKRVKRMINKNDIIVITGGGYMGSIWPDAQKYVEEILADYSENRIILAPQTVFYDNETGIERFKNLLLNHGKVYAIAREENTYKFMQDRLGLSPGKECGIMPDMVMYMKAKFNRNIKRKGIGICLRDDCERILDKNILNEIYNVFRKQNITKIKMAYNHIEIPIWLRVCFVRKKLGQYLKKELVITDRLHGLIFAAVTGTPCIAFDNVSKKVSGVYDKWLKNVGYIWLVKDENGFKDAIEQFRLNKFMQHDNSAYAQNLYKNSLDSVIHDISKWLK